MDLLFNIFILPIELLIQTILDVVFALTNNYGTSLFVLSVIISILVLPLHYLADYLKVQHQNELAKLQFEVDILKENYSGQELHYYLQALYKLNNYHTLRSSIKSSFGLLLQIPFFFAAFHFFGNYDAFNGVSFGLIQDLGQPDRLLFGQNILPIFMMMISLFSTYVYSKSVSRGDKYQLWGLSVIFLILLYSESSALLLYWTTNSLFFLIKGLVEEKFDITRIKHVSVKLLVSLAQAVSQNRIVSFLIKDIFSQAIILFFGIVFIYKAIPVAASNTGVYSDDYFQVVFSLLIFFLVSTAITLSIYHYLSQKWRYTVTVLATFAALSGLFHAFIMPFEMGRLSTLYIPAVVTPGSPEENIIILLLIALLLVPWFFFLKRVKNTVWLVLILSNFLLTAQALVDGSNPKTVSLIVDKDSQDMSLDQADKFYAFSKESNTIVIMMDRFQGNMFAEIIAKKPEVKQQFSGFVYYPNTLSHGSTTWTSIGAIVGGKDFQMHLIPKRNDYQKLAKNWPYLDYVPKNPAFLNSLAIAKKYRHSYDIFEPIFVSCDLFNSYNHATCLRKVVTDPELLLQKNKVLMDSNNSVFKTAKFFTKLSFILSLPHQVKNPAITLFRDKNEVFFDGYFTQIYRYSQLKNMASFANSNSNKKTFKFIHNMLTHDNWVNSSCQVVSQKFEERQSLINAGNCTIQLLNDFFAKLKKIGIYDRTKIIIVSDHGARNNIEFDDKDFSIQDSRASALMIVKDFNQSGELKTSMQLLSNMDTYGIALSGVSEGIETQLDRIITPQEGRSLVYIQKVKPRTYNITKSFIVKDNIFNKQNWKELTSKEIQQLGR